MYQFNPNTHSFVEVKEASRLERIKRTRVPRWVVFLIAIVPPVILASIVFTGCGQDVKTVEYYQEHTAERDVKISECMNNPGQAKDDPNCVNAGSAKLHSGIAIEPGKAPDGRRYENFR